MKERSVEVARDKYRCGRQLTLNHTLQSQSDAETHRSPLWEELL